MTNESTPEMFAEVVTAASSTAARAIGSVSDIVIIVAIAVHPDTGMIRSVTSVHPDSPFMQQLAGDAGKAVTVAIKTVLDAAKAAAESDLPDPTAH